MSIPQVNITNSFDIMCQQRDNKNGGSFYSESYTAMSLHTKEESFELIKFIIKLNSKHAPEEYPLEKIIVDVHNNEELYDFLKDKFKSNDSVIIKNTEY